MKSRTLVLLGCVALVGALAWEFISHRGDRSAPAASVTKPTAAAPLPGAATTPGLTTTADRDGVFQRAFWRKPDASVRVVEAERREWADEKAAVQKWQWFLSLETKPAFRAWLFDQNPFELSRAAGDAALPDLSSAPAWFPPAATLRELNAYRTPGSGLRVFLDSTTGRVYATDAGSGFTPAQR